MFSTIATSLPWSRTSRDPAQDMSTLLLVGVEDTTTAVDVHYDYRFRVMVVGKPGVGKTSFLKRYCDDKFDSAYISTVGIDLRVKTMYR